MLSFQSQDLIVSLFRNSLSLISSSVKILGFIVSFVDFLVVSVVDSDLVSHLFSHNINLLSEGSVFSLQFVIFNERFVKLVFQSFNFVEILLSFSGWWSNSFFLVDLVTNGLFLIVIASGVEGGNFESSIKLDLLLLFS
jgi:hypothetical protein